MKKDKDKTKADEARKKAEELEEISDEALEDVAGGDGAAATLDAGGAFGDFF